MHGENSLKGGVGKMDPKESGEEKIEESCACLYYAMEQARMIKKEPSLYKLTCKGCGREFLSNMEKEYCFDCEKKRE